MAAAAQISLRTEKGLAELNALLAARSFVGDTAAATSEDFAQFSKIHVLPDRELYPHLLRWFAQVKALRSGTAAAHREPAAAAAAPAPAAPAAEGPKGRAAGKASQQKPKGPLYAGLDVEARALSHLGNIDLGQWFWSEEHNSALDSVGAPRDVNLFDARCHEPGESAEGWRLPARLHVTVKFLGGDADHPDRREVDGLVGTWHSVEVRALVFLRGGGLLCAEVALDGPDSEPLKALAGDGWRPHITLLNSYPYQAKDSTAVLQAYAAAAAAAAGPSEVVDLDAPTSPPQEGLSAADRELAESMRSAMQNGSPASSVLKEPRMFTDTVLPGGLGTVDLCVIPLSPPRDLGPCKFKLFYK